MYIMILSLLYNLKICAIMSVIKRVAWASVGSIGDPFFIPKRPQAQATHPTVAFLFWRDYARNNS